MTSPRTDRAEISSAVFRPVEPAFRRACRVPLLFGGAENIGRSETHY
jgi:hypothetical protein